VKGTRHREEQIIAIPGQGEAGVSTAELCRQHNITGRRTTAGRRSTGGTDNSDTAWQLIDRKSM